MYTVLMKTGSTDTSLSILVTTVCLVCNANVGIGKKCNAEPLLMITSKDYISKYNNSEIRIHAAQDLKRNLPQRYEIFYTHIKRARATSYRSQKKIPKKMKHFEDGNVITEV
jgi:hypothetical protein